MKNKVAIYLRKSRDDEFETREETLKRHETMLIEYVNRNNLIVTDIFREVVSGESLENRPEALKMLDNVRSGLYDGVVVVELERLSRGNQVDQAEIMEIFKKSGTKIYTLNKVYDLASENEFDEDFFEFGLFMSRREYKVIKRRLLRGKKQAQKDGYYVGSRLVYGYDKEKRGKGFVLVPNESESEVVRLIFHKFVNEGMSLAEVRDYLIKSGIRPQTAHEWSSPLIKYMLRNKTYVGYLLHDKKTKDRGWYEGLHEPLISEELFNQAQEKLQITSAKNTFMKPLKNPLASLVKCGACGHSMQRHDCRGRVVLRCHTTGCPTVSVRFDDVERRIIAALRDELTGFRYLVSNKENTLKTQIKAVQREISILQSELKKKELQIDKACEMLECGIYSKEKYLSRVETLEKNIAEIKDSISVLKNRTFDDEIRAENAIPILEKCLDEYWHLDTRAKNEILKSIIKKVIFTKTVRNSRYDKDLSDAKLELHLKI